MNVLITGASRGIGRSTAEIFAQNGYNLALNCQYSKDKLLAFSNYLSEKYSIDVNCYIGDVGDYNFVQKMAKDVLHDFKDIDVLINNAGISHFGLLSDLKIEEWNNIISVNLSSIFYICHEFIPHMVHKKSGRIINVSSIFGEVGASCEAAYSATKGGIIALSKSLAKELAPSGISVNVISPGLINTDMNNYFTKDEIDDIISNIPIMRIGESMEVAKIIYSVANMPHFMTGDVIRVDGGMI